jgi:hypothetical protein
MTTNQELDASENSRSHSESQDIKFTTPSKDLLNESTKTSDNIETKEATSSPGIIYNKSI